MMIVSAACSIALGRERHHLDIAVGSTAAA
jgi:hypothetical protein